MNRINQTKPLTRRVWTGVLLATLFFAPLALISTGCRKPSPSDLTGSGRLHDITKIKRGMSPNEVRRIMGSNYKTIYEEGLQGMDMGIYIWEYAEGRVYFDPDGARKVVPYK